MPVLYDTNMIPMVKLGVRVGGGRCKERQGDARKMKDLLAASIAVLGEAGFRKGLFFLFLLVVVFSSLLFLFSFSSFAEARKE